MQLQEMGFSPKVEKLAHDLAFDSFSLGRVISEHKERYVVATENGDVDAEITGNLRFTAQCREDFPAVGDWVALIQCDQQFAVIHKIVPRFSAMKRQSVKNRSESQIIASNIDVALLVQSVDRDFNINRLERYLAICYSSTIEPIIVFTKVDLYDKEHLSKIISH
ncbi:MAG TPA: GTPase RsgA, partial [Prolixibacteraceae bacterium]|nr:GTPase RsgA [Prolixibacteraceae bacterium]